MSSPSPKFQSPKSKKGPTWADPKVWGVAMLTLKSPTGCPKKKCRNDSNCHNSVKIGPRNKSGVSFEILRKSSCWWALKFFNFNFWGLRKWGFKLVTLCLQAWPNQPFSCPVCLGLIEKWNTLYTWASIPLPQKIIIDDMCFKNTIKKYSYGRQWCFNSNYV